LHESAKDGEITDNLVAAPDSRSPVSRIAQVDRESTREEREEPFAIWRIRREELLVLRSCPDRNARAGGMRADVRGSRGTTALLLMSRAHCNVRAGLNNPNGTGSGDCRETGFGFPRALADDKGEPRQTGGH